MRDEVGVGQWSQFDEPDPVRIVRQDASRELDCQPGLAAPADARQGEQAGAAKPFCDLRQVALPTDQVGEWRGRLWGPVPRLSGSASPWRRTGWIADRTRASPSGA